MPHSSLNLSTLEFVNKNLCLPNQMQPIVAEKSSPELTLDLTKNSNHIIQIGMAKPNLCVHRWLINKPLLFVLRLSVVFCLQVCMIKLLLPIHKESTEKQKLKGIW